MDWDLKPVPHTRPPQFILEKMSIDLNLPIMIFLPYGVPEKLHDHEMGHLKICQKVYDEAAQSALDYGKRMIGQTFVARVGYAADAKQTVIREAHVDFDQQFRKQSEDETDKISDFYDQITHHGLNNVNPDQGVTMALQKYAQWRANGGTDGQQPPQIKGPSAAQDSVKINSDDKAVKKDRQKSK
jgi:superfamily II DNA helicase RecQ